MSKYKVVYGSIGYLMVLVEPIIQNIS